MNKKSTEELAGIISVEQTRTNMLQAMWVAVKAGVAANVCVLGKTQECNSGRHIMHYYKVQCLVEM